jgi:hypothetical protein
MEENIEICKQCEYCVGSCCSVLGCIQTGKIEFNVQVCPLNKWTISVLTNNENTNSK